MKDSKRPADSADLRPLPAGPASGASATEPQPVFEPLWGAHRPKVENWARQHCRRLGLPPDEVHDIVQDVSLDLLKVLRQGNPPSRPAGFLKRVTARRAVDRVRRDRTYQEVGSASSEEDTDTWKQLLLASLQSRDPASDPAAAAIAEAFRADLVAALAEIPVSRGQAFTLVDLRGATFAEAAAAMQAPEGTVKTWVRTAREELKRKLWARGWTSE